MSPGTRGRCWVHRPGVVADADGPGAGSEVGERVAMMVMIIGEETGAGSDQAYDGNDRGQGSPFHGRVRARAAAYAYIRI
jgi:hypothetical protein